MTDTTATSDEARVAQDVDEARMRALGAARTWALIGLDCDAGVAKEAEVVRKVDAYAAAAASEARADARALYAAWTIIEEARDFSDESVINAVEEAFDALVPIEDRLASRYGTQEDEAR